MTRRRRNSACRSNSCLGFERLNDRLLLAGNIAASFSNGTLTLSGDIADNGVVVSTFQSQNGTGVRIQGQFNNGNTAVNGQFAAVDFFGVSNLQVSLGAGNDSLAISNNVPAMLSCFEGIDPIVPVTDVVLSGQIAIAMGDGFNSVDLGWVRTGSRLLIETGAQNDLVRVCGLDVATNFTIRTFGGADEVHVHDSIVDGTTSLRLANGESFVGVDGLTSNGLYVYGGNHADFMAFNGLSISNDTSLQGNLGNDTLHLGRIDNLPWDATIDPNSIGDRLVVRPGDGANSVDVRFTTAREFSIVGGANYDEVFLSAVSTAAHIFIDTNNGNGWVELDDVETNTYLNVVMGSSADYLRVANSNVGTSSTLTLLGGNDIVEIENVDYFNHLTVLLGDGNDDLYLSLSSAQRANLYGNAGFDRYFFGGNVFGDENVFSFEQF